MERLTERNELGEAYYKKCFEEPCEGFGESDCTVCDYYNETVCEALAAYEDLGITPEQVREIDRDYRELCEKLNRYRAVEERLENMFGGKLPLETVVDDLEYVLTEPDSPHPVNAKILTHAESAEWEEYQRLKKEGLLLKLPCKVGDTLYLLDKYNRQWKIKGFTVKEFVYRAYRIPRIEIYFEEDSIMFETCLLNGELNENLFLTLEEAEQALAEMKGA